VLLPGIMGFISTNSLLGRDTERWLRFQQRFDCEIQGNILGVKLFDVCGLLPSRFIEINSLN